MKPLQLTPWLLVALCGAAHAATPAEESPSLSALSRGVEVVVRGTVLDQERAPGGLWHRFQVLEAIWPPEPAGPVLRIFAHGAGVPEGADLAVGSECIVGLDRLAPPAESAADPFARKLWEGFRPDRAGERPCIVAPDGLVPLDGSADLAEAVTRLVRTLRDPSIAAIERETALLDLASHRAPGVRLEAVRQLALLPEDVRAADRGRILDRFEAEMSGPAHPAVLAAHLDLAASLGGDQTRQLIAQVLGQAERGELSARAAAALAERGEAGDLEALAVEYVSSAAMGQVAIVDALGRRSRPEALPFLSAAARSPHLAVRLAAARALGRQRAADAKPLLRLLRDDSDPAVSRAAAEEESFLSAGRAAGRSALPFEAARRRLRTELQERTP